MAKKIKKFDSRYEVVVPEVVSMDDLAYITDSELVCREDDLHGDRERALKAGEVDVRKWEVELAYVHREMGIRNDRKIAHEKYLRLNPDALENIPAIQQVN
jgi:hypothetical protein